MKFRHIFEGAGVAILMLASFIWPQLSPSHLAFYHDAHPTWTIAAGLALDMLAACALFAGALALLDRYRPQQTGPLWAALLALLLLEAADFVVYFLGFYQINVDWTTAVREGLLFVVLAAALLLSWFLPRALRQSIQIARLWLALLGCCIFWMLPELALTAIRADAAAITEFDTGVQHSSPSQRRVIWILLDELSYDQVFEHRQPNVKLPHFDELKKESAVFSDLQPEGYYTERIVPALFMGQKIDDIRSSVSRSLEYHDVARRRWEMFSQQSTLFGEARRAGWTTGVVGWYNPYCYILHDVLDSCYWQNIVPFPGTIPGERPTLADAAALPVRWKMLQDTVPLYKSVVLAHTQEYKDLTAAADSLIRDENIDFAFIHLPVPHPVGIYSRRTNTLGAIGTYLDNVALADKTLAYFLDAVQGTQAASRTILIVSSDHSWRVNKWRRDSLWTAEDQLASGGRFDPRPFLLIHFPGSENGEVRPEAFQELDEHGIIEAMLKHKVQSQADLDRWLNAREAESGPNLSDGEQKPLAKAP